MTGRGGARGTRAAMATAVVLLLAAPGHVAASDRAVLLPGVTQLAVVVDIDGDGAREVLRTVAESAASIDLEVWKLVDGGWTMVASAPVPNGPSENAADRAPGPMTLVVARVEDRERGILVLAGTEEVEQAIQTCCLVIYEVSLRGGRLRMDRAGGTAAGADQLLPADLDADGTDELLAAQTRFSEDGATATSHVELLRRQSGAWTSIFALEEPGHGHPALSGETDGVPGREILLGPSEHGSVQRLAMVGDRVVTDEASFGTGEDFGSFVHGAASGRLVVSRPDGLAVMRWPRGSPPETLHRLSGGPWYPTQVIGEGPEAIIATSTAPGFETPSATSMTMLYDMDLTELARVPSSPLAARLWDLIYRPSSSGAFALNRSVEPVMGPVPGGWADGRPALVSAGSLIRAGGGGVDITPMATLVGSQIVGMAGPDSAWAVVGSGLYWPMQGGSMLWGMMAEAPSLTLAPVDALLGPDRPMPASSVELRDAVITGVEGDRSELLAHGDGFGLSVTAEPGSVVVLTDGALWEAREIVSDPVEMRVRPPRRSDDKNLAFERWLFLIRPDGTGSSQHWEGTFLREAPALSATAETEPFSLVSTVTGSVSQGMTVSIDGVPVEVNRIGNFRAEVDAPIWPQGVVVVASDPFGAERTERIEIVGFLDYRGLPWIPIVGVLTVVLGGLWFVRTPRHRPLQLAPDGDGRLEEIDGDLT